MPDSAGVRGSSAQTADDTAVEGLRRALEDGRDWPTALLEAIAVWAAPEEEYQGRGFVYLIGGEAFDWLLLAERLLLDVADMVSAEEREDLLFAGSLPRSFDGAAFKGILGVEKYRGVLNYHYGVTVEEALQLAVEGEVQKRQAGNGVRYRDDPTDEAFLLLYGAPPEDLLSLCRQETGAQHDGEISLAESKAFTYWLFKYRLWKSDKARIASDTRKGLDQLDRMRDAWRG